MKFPTIGILAKPVKHQVSAMGHLERTFKTAGYRTRLSYDATSPEAIVVCWGWGKAKEVRAKNPNAIILCLDHGYTKDRKHHINTAWSTPAQRFGLNGFGEHAWVDDGGARWRQYGWDREVTDPPKWQGKRGLMLGQVYGDAMIVDHVEDYGAWLRSTIGELQEAGWDMTFRPHPQTVARGTQGVYGNLGRVDAGGPLEEALGGYDMVAAMNSNGLVTGLQRGLDVRLWNKGSMLSPIMGSPGDPVYRESRYRLFDRLAWAQWTYEELDNGTWLGYHAPIMHRLVDGGPAVPWHDRRLT